MPEPQIIDLAQSPVAARAGDSQVLSNVARGYRNGRYVSDRLFPIVPVGKRSGLIAAFGAEAFAVRDIRRAPAAEIQLLDIQYRGEPYALVQRALGGLVPIENVEEANAGPGIDVSRATVNSVMDSVMLQIEVEAAALATDAGKYPGANVAALAGTARWDHADARPAAAVKRARRQVRNHIGVRPNTLVVSGDVHEALTECPDVIDRVKHVRGLGDAGDMYIGESDLATYFGVDHYHVGTVARGEPGAFVEVWGKNAILAYTNVGSMTMATPSYGYTYRLRGYPRTSEAYWIESRRSWCHAVVTEDSPVIAAPGAAFLWTSVIA